MVFVVKDKIRQRGNKESKSIGTFLFGSIKTEYEKCKLVNNFFIKTGI